MSPSGETMTMARKMKPITVLNVPPITGRPDDGMRFVISLLMERNAIAPSQAPFDPSQASDDGDDEQLDRRVEPHRGRRELPEPPRVEDAG